MGVGLHQQVGAVAEDVGCSSDLPDVAAWRTIWVAAVCRSPCDDSRGTSALAIGLSRVASKLRGDTTRPFRVATTRSLSSQSDPAASRSSARNRRWLTCNCFVVDRDRSARPRILPLAPLWTAGNVNHGSLNPHHLLSQVHRSPFQPQKFTAAKPTEYS